MADVFLLHKKSSEQRKIIGYIKNSIAILSDDDFYVNKFSTIEEAYGFVDSGEKIDIALVEVNDTSDINFLVRFREVNPNTEIMLLASSLLSPMEYLTPKIRASSLILVPYDKERMKNVVLDFLSDYYGHRNKVSNEKTFVINSKDGKVYIPFSKIFYIEVRDKHVYFRLQNREYSQFGTLENVLKSFPDSFLRCHRSYAFNTKFLSSIRFSENIIFLNHGISVPLSRSYKKEVKEYLNGTGNG